ncbi:lipocalin family protein [Pedobacter sp. Leaf194]|uniref:lipocalin family protein n=1 Tax=Pedobacter sp. Leaf194 TaxID=1736297 RepID=UPI000703AB22|nr:lipocalin family protein [Pedobacter sp. Leaf194]KQS34530.1 hypothetical protein ASG14_15555 [Pedobacter sp. Leaf194]
MKRLFIAIAIACSTLVMLQSCSSTKNAASGISGGRGTVTGTWVLNNITLEGLPDQAVQGLFGEKSYKCFQGSTWKLTNSGNGSYTLPASSACGAVMQTIYWSATPAEETFQFKKIFEGDKAKNVTEGYRLVLSQLSKGNMVLKSPIEFGGKTANIVLTFSPAVN